MVEGELILLEAIVEPATLESKGKRAMPNGFQFKRTTGHEMSRDTQLIKITTKDCCVCGKTSELYVPFIGFKNWRDGMNIQNALPNLTVDERELLLTGTHHDCFMTLVGKAE